MSIFFPCFRFCAWFLQVPNICAQLTVISPSWRYERFTKFLISYISKKVSTIQEYKLMEYPCMRFNMNNVALRTVMNAAVVNIFWFSLSASCTLKAFWQFHFQISWRFILKFFAVFIQIMALFQKTLLWISNFNSIKCHEHAHIRQKWSRSPSFHV